MKLKGERNLNLDQNINQNQNNKVYITFNSFKLIAYLVIYRNW